MGKRKNKIRLAVIFGGRSGEHEVSLCSAASVIPALDSGKYAVLPVYVDKKGAWRLEMGFPNEDRGYSRPVILLPDPNKKALLDPSTHRLVSQVDVVLPLIHGTYGEDGCLQGLLEMAELPYATCGVMSSAVSMDKAIQKQLWRDAGLPVVPWIDFTRQRWFAEAARIRQAVRRLKYPVFVKPANLGSSVGISKVKSANRLKAAVEEAFRYDTKAVVEQAIDPAREIEFAVIGTSDRPEISVPGEVVPSNEFYDYSAKYVNGESELVIPADLPKALKDKLTRLAAQAWGAVDGHGFARVDFLVNAKTGRVFINEINTVPGFTEFSMFPQLWEASGLTYGALLDRLVSLAQERHRERRRLSRSFKVPAKPAKKPSGQKPKGDGKKRGGGRG